MNLRRVGFVGAMALLYLGPVLAGLIGAPFQAVPVFALIFLIWLIVMRPAHSIGASPDWTDPGLWLRLLATLLIQLALVAFCWGAGLLLAHVAPAPDITLAWPLALSALSIPLSRACRAPYTAEMDAVLDEAIETLEQAGATTPPEAETLSTREKLLVDLAYDAICSLPPDAGVDAITTVTGTLTRPLPLFTLIDRLKAAPDSHAPTVLAQSVLAFRPDFISVSTYDDDQWDALDRALASGNPHVIRQSAELAAAAIADAPLNLPPDAELLSAAARLADQGQEPAAHSLRALVKSRSFSAAETAQESPTDD